MHNIRVRNRVPRRGLRQFLLVLAALVAGCQPGDDAAAPAPSHPPVARLTRIPDAARTWSVDEAADRLDDVSNATSAAWRLIDLAEQAPACLPADLTAAQFDRLRVVSLSADWYAVGVADHDADDRVHAPVLLSSAGTVERLAVGLDEELATLRVSADADVFPHVIVTPTRIVSIVDEPVTAIVLEPNQPACFALRSTEGYPYVALIPLGADQSAPVAEYRWDPWELVFTGPLIDALPDPPGGKFHIDLAASPLLIPMGGELPEPKPVPDPEDSPPRSPYDSRALPA